MRFLSKTAFRARRSFTLQASIDVKLQKESKGRDEVLRGNWIEKLGGYTAEQLVFLDESGINTHASERTHGWAPKGQIIRRQVPGPRSQNYSVLPAYTVDGYIACNIYQGAVNGERFCAFLENDVLPKCSKYPGPRSVIVMDNATVHNVIDPVFTSINYGGCSVPH